MGDRQEQGRAQRWHDTDHGTDRPAARHWYGRTKGKDTIPEWVSSCWCCCELCNPDWAPPRPNPFWTRAAAEMRIR